MNTSSSSTILDDISKEDQEDEIDEEEIKRQQENKKFEDTNELKMISSIRNNLSIWTQNETSNEEFYKKTQ